MKGIYPSLISIVFKCLYYNVQNYKKNSNKTNLSQLFSVLLQKKFDYQEFDDHQRKIVTTNKLSRQ